MLTIDVIWFSVESRQSSLIIIMQQRVISIAACPPPSSASPPTQLSELEDDEIKPELPPSHASRLLLFLHSLARPLQNPRSILAIMFALLVLASYLTLALYTNDDENDNGWGGSMHRAWEAMQQYRWQQGSGEPVHSLSIDSRWKRRPDPARATLEQRGGEGSANENGIPAASIPSSNEVRGAAALFSSSTVDPMSAYTRCHNTRQGRMLVTDDSGVICTRNQLLSNGCCGNKGDIEHLSCSMCRTDVQCCRSYEYCVSCCLKHLPPSDRAPDSIDKSSPNIPLTAKSRARPRFSFHSFDRCLHLCRTSSRSIHHGNKFKTPVLRHCYTEGDHSLPIDFQQETMVLVAKQGISCNRACAMYKGPMIHGGVDAVAAIVNGGGSDAEPDPDPDMDAPSDTLPPTLPPPLYICHEPFLPLLNNCDRMRQYFACNNDKCDQNAGNDQPALLVAQTPTSPLVVSSTPASASSSPSSVVKPSGQCLLNGDSKLFDCDGHHESTRRLCPCILADKAE